MENYQLNIYTTGGGGASFAMKVAFSKLAEHQDWQERIHQEVVEK